MTACFILGRNMVGQLSVILSEVCSSARGKRISLERWYLGYNHPDRSKVISALSGSVGCGGIEST